MSNPNKENEEIINKFASKFSVVINSKGELATDFLRQALLSKDTEIQKAREEERERIYKKVIFVLEPYDNSKWLNTPTREQLKNIIIENK